MIATDSRTIEKDQRTSMTEKDSEKKLQMRPMTKAGPTRYQIMKLSRSAS